MRSTIARAVVERRMDGAAIGLIVGSGFDRLGLEVVARSPTKTPYGAPSSAVLTVEIDGVRALCIARHGEHHAFAPHEVNYRANVWALAQCGVERCIALNTVGAIGTELAPGGLAVPQQLIDYTTGRAATFGGDGKPVVHVDFTDPFDADLRARIVKAAEAAGLTPVGGVYGVTQGPRLETAAEIARLGRDGCTMVGMTALPEAALARELGMRYAVLALAVNYAAGLGPPRATPSASIPTQIEEHVTAGMRHFAAVLGQLVPELARSTPQR
jgi:5'-deoxy-5'-methylthioadenosine phosphorylase